MNDNEIIKGVLSRTPPKILTKRECYILYESGFFGNKALTWNSLKELQESDWNGMICIRNKNIWGGGKTKYNVPIDQIENEIIKLEQEGFKLDQLKFNQSMPDELLLIQGEVMINPRTGGLYLYYTQIKKPMNLALKENAKHALRLNAKMILTSNLSPFSLSDLESLLEIFPESVIEFSSYSIQVGNIPNRNTVIWEVRNY